MLTSSGRGAVKLLFAGSNLVSAGDHVVASAAIYGGTFNLFAVTMKRMGIDFTFVDPNCSEEELRRRFPAQHREAVFGETMADARPHLFWTLRSLPAPPTPMGCLSSWTIPLPPRWAAGPSEWGADTVTRSTAKYMDGHANCVGGAIVDSGNFDWTRYHGPLPRPVHPG